MLIYEITMGVHSSLKQVVLVTILVLTCKKNSFIVLFQLSDTVDDVKSSSFVVEQLRQVPILGHE